MTADYFYRHAEFKVNYDIARTVWDVSIIGRDSEKICWIAHEYCNEYSEIPEAFKTIMAVAEKDIREGRIK